MQQQTIIWYCSKEITRLNAVQTNYSTTFTLGTGESGRWLTDRCQEVFWAEEVAVVLFTGTKQKRGCCRQVVISSGLTVVTVSRESRPVSSPLSITTWIVFIQANHHVPKATMYGSCVCLFTEQIFRIWLSYSCICFQNVICFILLRHTISLKVVLFFCPIRRTETKTNCDSLIHVFPRFRISSIFWF